MSRQPSVPLSFAVALTAVALFGVGAGFAVFPAGTGASRSITTPSDSNAPADEVTTTTPIVTTSTTIPSAETHVVGPRCMSTSGAPMGALPNPTFIAGTEGSLIGLVATALGATPVPGSAATLTTSLSTRNGQSGALILRETEEEAAQSIRQNPFPRLQVIFLRNSNDTRPMQTAYPAVLLVAGENDGTNATELAAVALIRDGSAACRPVPAS